LQKLHEEVFLEMQEYKKQLVGISEIKKDRDDRIEKLREEFEFVSKNFETLDKEHTGLKITYEHIFEEHESLKMDFDSVSEKLKVSNKVRNEKEEALNEKIKLN
jgi:chromosome segregation ATPase